MSNWDLFRVGKKIFAFSLLLSMLISCASNKQVAVASKQKELQNKILFINLKLTKDEELKLELVNKKVVDGKLKEKLPYKEMLNAGDLKIDILNGNSEVVASTFVESPLVQNLEYADENGELKMKKVILKDAPVLIRLQLEPEMKYIQFLPVLLGNVEGKELLKIDLD